MKVFVDLFNGDEVLSDALLPNLEYNNSIYTVKSKYVPLEEGNVDIGCGNAFGGAEDDDTNPDPNVPKVNNIIHNFSLEEYYCSKADFKDLIKESVGKVKEILKDKPDRLKEWEKGGAVATFLGNVYKNFENEDWDLKIYMGKTYGNSSDPKESMIIVSYWVDGSDSGETFHFFKDCLREVKC